MTHRHIDARAALAHYTAVQDMANTAANAELVRRVEAEAAAATALPRWWPEAAALVVILTGALSAAFPWGWAS
jgi:hypothetical protein